MLHVGQVWGRPDNLLVPLVLNIIEHMGFLSKFAETPPITLLARQIIKRLPNSAMAKVAWNATPRPHYLLGVYKAAKSAKAANLKDVSVIEFGVAGGAGLLCLQSYAESVDETGVRVRVYGFDSGQGLPEFCGDYRDHPDQWRPCDYPMDFDKLKNSLTDRTSLVIGDVRETVVRFVDSADYPPIGFIAYDLDLYSSTRAALAVLGSERRRMLLRVFLYFDDLDSEHNHRFAGELLAIDEFNDENVEVKIDRWRGVQRYCVFPAASWLARMYIAHDLAVINSIRLSRPLVKL